MHSVVTLSNKRIAISIDKSVKTYTNKVYDKKDTLSN